MTPLLVTILPHGSPACPVSAQLSCITLALFPMIIMTCDRNADHLWPWDIRGLWAQQKDSSTARI